MNLKREEQRYMANDTWETPAEIFDALDREFEFDLDACAEHATAKCPDYFTIEDDSLSIDWARYNGGFSCVWCNPPYSKIGPWVEKAIESQQKGVRTVMLVMCDPSVGWFKKAIKYASETRFIVGGRLAFLRNGVRVAGNNKGSVIFVFDPHRIGTNHTSYVDRDALIKKGAR